jgi:hypothetical protein
MLEWEGWIPIGLPHWSDRMACYLEAMKPLMNPEKPTSSDEKEIVPF